MLHQSNNVIQNLLYLILHYFFHNLSPKSYADKFSFTDYNIISLSSRKTAEIAFKMSVTPELGYIHEIIFPATDHNKHYSKKREKYLPCNNNWFP